jgi:predicted nucleotidyltransferase
MKHKILFKCIVGSQAQGTSTPQSDIDIKGIYIQNMDDIITFDYEEYVEVSKDESYYEIKRFIELLLSANPNAIEILFSPEDCVIETTPQFKLLQEHKNIFLTKKCYNTFAGYANMQIKKATGLDKKMNWETQRIERKTPLDFCYIHFDGKTSPVVNFLKNHNMSQERCGLINLDHFKDTYAMYYDYGENINFRGIIGENSNELRLSSISKEHAEKQMPATLYYNKDGYTMHCKDYKSYQTWLAERNTNRYHTNKSHGQIYDSKNLSHCRRLIDIAIEIAQTGTFTVRRQNSDYLMAIKRGDVSLDQIIADASRDIAGLEELYKNSNLPDDVDRDIVKDLLLKIRKM